ncbi:sds23/moc1 [Apiospora phragmitis]|uniref:Sds23/moc1 n=1 Tax=Apiospora phragmitis TaxID=2905665 RepID=A0ABR1VY81_9PEZI
MEPSNSTSAVDPAKEMSISPPTQPSRSHSSSSLGREPTRATPVPRSARHPSLTQAALQDLLNHPPTSKAHNPRFAGRDWRDVAVGELASKDDVKWVTMDTSVEEATMVLLKNTTNNVVLIKENAESTTPISTFDCNDLNAYLLVVVGLGNPSEELVPLFDTLAKKAQAHEDIPLRDIQPLCRKESLVTMHGDANLAKVIEVFGSGIHRFLVTNNAGEVIGILSQLTLVEFFWNEGVNFRAIDELYPLTLKDLGVGSQQIVAISPLADALALMNNEGLSSVAVVDNKSNVVGNISTIDVRLLTNAASLPLLQNTCMHFVSVILNERGMEQGKDSFPVFYVNPYSTLAHTVAKLVATKSHRMWVVESASPSPSAPATPLLGSPSPRARLVQNQLGVGHRHADALLFGPVDLALGPEQLVRASHGRGDADGHPQPLRANVRSEPCRSQRAARPPTEKL